jgi:hypothetical protein
MWTRKNTKTNPPATKPRRRGYRGYGSPNWGEKRSLWGRWFGGVLLPEAGLPPAHLGGTSPHRA